MSTNPFRQSQFESLPEHSDGGGLRANELSIDTRVISNPLDRHVSFASPPVNSTIPPASYPSSPESARSPPVPYGQHTSPFTPDYRTALQSNPFESLGQENREDHTIRQALQNTQSNVISEQITATVNQHNAVQNTLSRFASAPRVAPPTTVRDSSGAHAAPLRQSMDVEAFQRLLLTGDSGQNSSTSPSLTNIQSMSKGVNDSGYGTDTASLSQSSVNDSNVFEFEEAPNISNKYDAGTALKQNPPPAPAPRRGKSVKTKTPPVIGNTHADAETKAQIEVDQPQSKSTASKKPPTPPLARRQSSKAPSLRNEETSTSTLSTTDPPSATSGPQQSKAPPPPPLRRQGTSSEQRRVSHDLAPTVEEPEPEALPVPFISSRKSSDAPAMPPPPPRSRNSSDASKRISMSPMNPPPVPPPRRGRGSSRSSFDSFRPSLASLTGDENNGPGEHVQYGQQGKDLDTLNSSNASNILAELADLQREVDAARRGA